MGSDKIYFIKLEGERRKRILGILKQMFEDDERIVLAYNFGSTTRRSKVRDIDLAVYVFCKKSTSNCF